MYTVRVSLIVTLPQYTIYIVLHTLYPMSTPNRTLVTNRDDIVTYCNI